MIKCNGVQPCNGCSKRNASCTYGTAGTGSDEQRSPKRQEIDPLSSLLAASSSVPTPGPRTMPRQNVPPIQDPKFIHSASVPNVQHQEAQQAKRQGPILLEPEAHLEVRGTSFGGKDEEALVESNPRLLEDPTGRVCK